MKKIAVVVLALAVLSSTSVFAAKKGKEAKQKIEIVDRPGIALGTEIPDWVVSVLEGENKKIAKSLPWLENTKI